MSAQSLNAHMFGSLLLLCALALPAGAGVPVEGDAALLQVLVDAQHTNQALFQRGAIKVEVQDKAAKKSVTATVVWEGGNTYWEYSLRQLAEFEGKAQTIQNDVRLIETPKTLMSYNLAGHVSIILDKSRAYDEYLRLRPDQVWFRYERQVNWSAYLDPEIAGDNIAKFTVRKNNDDRVIVERHFKAGGFLKIEASLQAGGNIVSYEHLPAFEGDWWRKGSYEWSKDANGNWYPTRYEYQRSRWGDPKRLNFDYVMEVKEFDPNPIIPKNRFELSSLKIVQGTSITELEGSSERSYSFGRKEQQRISQENLDRLAQKLRAEGFAAAEKDEND